LYDHAHEQPIMYAPLIVLAFFSVFAGNFLGERTFLTNSIKESNQYCQRAVAAGKHFAGFDSAWPADLPEPGEAKPEHNAAFEAHEKGEELVAPFKSALFYAFIGGIGLGFLLYADGYSVARKLHAIKPLGWIHEWLYRRMYFDELYFSVFVAVVMGLSKFAGFFDKYVVDGLVNLVGWTTKGISSLAGLNDRVVIDGAVNGAASLAQGVGAAVRAPQTGRVRMYVTVLMIAVALGFAGAIIVILSR
jgi:NADH:ubiquinone oxidoreductase subunit 5 (subunit L)/multisubunit Na+/H+ antiporter MnhA subunit